MSIAGNDYYFEAGTVDTIFHSSSRSPSPAVLGGSHTPWLLPISVSASLLASAQQLSPALGVFYQLTYRAARQCHNPVPPGVTVNQWNNFEVYSAWFISGSLRHWIPVTYSGCSLISAPFIGLTSYPNSLPNHSLVLPEVTSQRDYGHSSPRLRVCLQGIHTETAFIWRQWSKYWAITSKVQESVGGQILKTN